MVLAHTSKIITKKKRKEKMMEDELIYISKIQKYLKEAYQNIADNMIGGGIDNMEKYKYMMGQAHAYLKISQEISNLLKPKEQNDTKTKPDNVIRFGDKD
jgi:hypothetical protein